MKFVAQLEISASANMETRQAPAAQPGQFDPFLIIQPYNTLGNKNSALVGKFFSENIHVGRIVRLARAIAACGCPQSIKVPVDQACLPVRRALPEQESSVRGKFKFNFIIKKAGMAVRFSGPVTPLE